MLNKESRTIDGVDFVATQFPAVRGFTILGKLVKTIGPALGTLASAGGDQDLAALAPQLATALSGLDPSAAASLMIEVLSCVSAMTTDDQGRMRSTQLDSQAAIDKVFSGRLGVMFKVIGLALQVNYSDFMAGSFPTAPGPTTPSAT
jgi:hypothetical protein